MSDFLSALRADGTEKQPSFLDELRGAEKTASAMDWIGVGASGALAPIAAVAKLGIDAMRNRASSGDYKRDAAQDDGFLDRSGTLFERGLQSAVGGMDRAVGTLTGIRGIRDRALTMENASGEAVAGETTWDEVKKAQGFWATVGKGAKFGLETAITSAPEMALTAIPYLGLAAESTIQAGRIAQQRAEANGQFEADRGDLAIAAPFGAGSTLLEKFGIDKLTGGMGGNIVSRIGKKTAIEAGTEAAQSAIEYTGGALGTDKGWDLGEAGDQALAGAVGGGVMGAGFAGSHEVGSAAVRRIGNRPVPRGTVAEAAQQSATLDQDDLDSPLPNDLIAQGLGQIGAGEATAEADRILSEAGMPALNRAVTVKMPDGRRMTGTVVDAFQTDTGEFGSSAGIKIRMNDGSLFEEHFDDMGGATIEPVAMTADEITAKMVSDAEAARVRSDAAIAAMEMPAPAEPENVSDFVASKPDTPVAAVAGPVGDAITGFKNKTRRVESGGKDNAKNPRSSAEGRYQFTDGTFKATYRAVYGAGLSDADILAKKFDPDVQEALMDRLTQDNAKSLQRGGHAVTEGNLYLAHFAGSGGANALLSADPSTPVEQVLGAKAVEANPFLRGKSASEVIAWAAGKMGGANPGSTPTAPAQAAETPDTPYVDPYAKGMAEYAAWQEEQRKASAKQPAPIEGPTLAPEAPSAPIDEIVTPSAPPTGDAGVVAPVDGGAPAQPTSPIRALIDSKKAGDEWSRFRDDETLGVPRADMPQIKAEHRGAMVNFVNARGISHAEETVAPSTLEATQAEFSTEKVRKALDFEGGDRAILVSSDNRIVDGHHQWLAALDKGEPIRVIRLDAPIKKILDTVKEMPSVTTDGGSGAASAATSAPASGTIPETGAASSEAIAPPQPAVAAPVASTPDIRDLGRDDGRYAVRTGAVIKSASGRALAPAPRWDDSTNLKTKGSLKRQKTWLLDEAKKEAAARGDTNMIGWLTNINPDNMAPADWSMVNQTLFDDSYGPQDQAPWRRGQPAFGTTEGGVTVGDRLSGGMSVDDAAAAARRVDRSAAIIMDPAAGTVKTVPLGGRRKVNPDAFIRIAADTIEELRKVDVERVIREAPAEHRAMLRDYIADKRSDLADEARESFDEVVGTVKTVPIGTQMRDRARDVAQRMVREGKATAGNTADATYSFGQKLPSQSGSQMTPGKVHVEFNAQPGKVYTFDEKEIRKAASVDAKPDTEQKPAGEVGIATQQDPVAPARDEQPGEGEDGDGQPIDPSPGRFSKNKIFTEDRVQAARDRLKAKLNRLNAGLDPEIAMDGAVIAGAYIEDGVLRFIDVARAVAADLGMKVADLKPYLRAFYNSARDMLEDGGHSVADMDDADAVRAAMADFDTWAREPSAPPARSTNGEATPNAELPNRLPDSDARSSARDVQRTAPEGPDGRAPRREGEGGAGTVQAADAGRADAAERGAAQPAGRERGDRAGVRNADRVPAAERVTGTDWTIDPGSLNEGRSFAQKARDNVEAIALVKQIEREGRPATKAEQQQIARYVGWGGIKNIFPDPQGNYGKGFETLGPRLRELLTDAEYETARRSIQYAHYTGETVVRAMWDAAQRLGFTGGSIFEPGMGTGNFRGMMPADLSQASRYSGLEYDHLTASIARLLYPESGVRQADYTRTPQVRDTFDLVIGNPPFSETAITGDPVYGKHKFLMHDFFFAKSLDAVKPGGLLMFVTSAGTLNKRDAKAREYLAERADLVGAIRLPGNAFEKNAGTSVTTDIVILRKRLPGEKPNDRTWVDTVNKTLPDRDGGTHTGSVNAYFDDHPEMVLGEQGFFDKLVAGVRYAVRAPDGFDLNKALSGAIETLSPRMVDSTPAELPAGYSAPEIDLSSTERKDGSYYLDADGKLMQYRGGVGKPVQGIGKGVQGGMSLKAQLRVKGLIPIKETLREVYAADVRNDDVAGAAAREKLNAAYDAFVKAFGPINKTDVSYRRPSRVEMEGLRAAAREDARLAGAEWNDGSFNIDDAIERGLTMAQIAAEREAARDAAVAAGRTWDEGDFDPSEVPDKSIEKRENLDPFIEDEESYRLAAIEHYNKETGEAAKGRAFFENAVRLDTAPQINSADDALMFSLNRLGRPDISLIAEMAGKSQSEVIEDLGERLFEVPGQPGTYATAESYLSGNVREKLATARAAAEKSPALRRNVTALEAAQPTPLTPTEIAANLGMPWLPPEIIGKFATEKLGLASATVKYQPKIAVWTAAGDSYSAAATTTWGTARMNAMDILEAALNRQTIQIYDTTADKKRVLNAVDTQAAQDKQTEMKAAFKEWVYSDAERAAALVASYNENYNALVAPKFDGTYLTTPGIASDWNWRPHQRAVIARIIQAGNTYMAHEVGAGKTSAMIGAGMEMKRLGLVNKPMYVVPNHMLGQFTKEFFEQYPLARIRVADETRFHTSRRKEFVARMAADDLDAVIITHSAFGYIGMSDEFQADLMQQQIDDLSDLLGKMDKGERVTRRKVEQQKEALEQRMQGMMNRKRDQVFTFEETGVDFLFVDEAHLFRKLDFTTKMSNVKGIDPQGSQASFDLYAKTRYLEQQKPGRNLVLASGTPITNTMAELYSISRYLQEGELAKRGLAHFDAWAGAFGDTVTALEQNAAGGYQPTTRFAQFVNVPELSVMVRQVMDVVGAAELRRYVSLPTLAGGERQMVMAEQTASQEEYQAKLAARMEAIKRRNGPPQKGDDILLSVINDGRKVAIDYRLIDASAPREEGSKLERMIDKVAQNHKAFTKTDFHTPLPDGKGFSEKARTHGPATQMIFSNLGINGDFPVHKYIKQSLIAQGIPADQVALISDYKTHVAKQRLFNDMNEGKVRVLIGSVAKMGTGVNAQKRLRAIHNMDAMWYPADDTQRNGRAIRQGNMNPEVEINDYATKGTYDSTMWAMMGRKGKFIEGFMRGDPTMRDMEDLGEASQYEQAAALTTADPRVMDLTEWKQEAEKLNRQRIAFERGQHDIRAKIANAENRVAYAERTIPLVKQDIATRTLPGEDDPFTAKAGKETFDDRAEFGAALQAGMEKMVNEAGGRERREGLGELAGFPIIGEARPGFKGEMVTTFLIKRAGGRETEVQSNDSRGLVTKLVNRMRNFENELDDLQASRDMNKRDIADFTPRIEGSYDDGGRAAELDSQIKALEEVLSKESAAAQAAATVQVQGEPPIDTRESVNEIVDQDQTGDEPADPEETPDQLWDRLDKRLTALNLDPTVELAIRSTLRPNDPGAIAGAFEVYGNATTGEVTSRIIAIALDSKTPHLMTLDHEVIHAMRNLGLFTDAEWAVLSRKATGDVALWTSIKERYSDLSEEKQIEEAVADMFKLWAQRKRRGAPLGAIERAFDRIMQFLQALGSFVRRQGFNTAENIMQAIDAGQIGLRESNPRPVNRGGETRYSIPDTTFDNAETEARWQDAKKGMQTQEGIRDRLTGWMAAGWAGISQHWISLPNTPRFAALQQKLRALEAAPQVAKERTVRMLEDMVGTFDRKELDLFTRKVVLDDLSWEVTQQHDLPFGLTPETLKAELDKVNAALQADPDKKVWGAVMKRKIVNKKLAQELVDAGVLEAEQIRNPTYYRHQVLEYARAQQKFAATPGGKLKAPKWAKRMGSTMDINANLLEAEFDWLNKAFMDIQIAKSIDWIKDSDHNIVGRLKQEARDQNKAGLDAALAAANDVLADKASSQKDMEAAAALVSGWKGANQRLGMGFSGLKAVIKSGVLKIPRHLQSAADSIENGPGSGDPPFALLNWILDNNMEGSIEAATVYKGIGLRNQIMRATLGKAFVDPSDANALVKRLAPEGYATWQPEEGKLLFTAKTLPEHAIDGMLDELKNAPPQGIDRDAWVARLEKAKSTLVVGGERYTMILPQEVADTLNQLRRPGEQSLMRWMVEKPVRSWKLWTLINPRRWAKYNINNMVGDLDAIIAGNPKLLRRVPEAAKELFIVMAKGGKPSARYEQAIERGVFDSGVSVQEIPDIHAFSAFARFGDESTLAKASRLTLGKAWNALQGSTQWRENVFRYAAYLDYVDRIEAGEAQRSIGYGASLRDMVDAVEDKQDKAALLARDLLGDYGAISHFGSGLRNTVIPFWSWMEMNTKRYKRLLANSFDEGFTQGLRAGSIVGVGRGVALSVQMAMVYGLIQLWNNLFWPDEDDELGEQQGRQLHIILGKTAGGEIVTLRTQGAMSDSLSWLGLGETANAFKEYERGRGSIGEILVQPVKATTNKLLTSLSPVISVPLENAMGKKFWPDIFNPRPNRDPYRNIAATLSLDNEYDALMDKPSRGYARSWQEAVLYRRDPGEIAYNEARGVAYDWLRRVKGQDGSSDNSSPRSNAARNFRTATKFGDQEAAEEALQEMGNLGVTRGDFNAMIKRAAPLSPIAKKDRRAFIEGLSDKEREAFVRAERWYAETFLPGGG